ncbi:TetR-like C-terminal domain-containing protein [Actinoplanes aureus]|uniref:TetR/AcrR family transcriptional regulator C-terminal ligand-binding domain-containing protein n=1 Tax=Actinoplanes aureus TaxID=2792083 RepID=A0A931G3A1_9ACTN|nr:TetR-like C-terminal domain-containing protein [Actinoplanes aureus]MBG0569025.1 TetR/AcrR family transcriptional regulator C-terminal ligand-binding domain-containing protein [Actinoplanes aureus]
MGDRPELDPDTAAAIVEATANVFAALWRPQMFASSDVAERMGMDSDDLYRLCLRPDLLYAEALGRERWVSEVPDLGSTSSELFQALIQLVGTYPAQSDSARTLLQMALTAGNDLESVARIRELGERKWRGVVMTVLERGIARGDLPPDADVEAIVDVLACAVTYHSVYSRGRENWSTIVRMLVDMVLSAAVPVRPSERLMHQPVTISPAVERAFHWLAEIRMGATLRAVDVPLVLMTQAPQNRAMLGDFPVTVEVGLHCDFSPKIASDDPLFRDFDNQGRLSVGVRVSTDKADVLPPSLQADRVVLVQGDEVWVAPLVELNPSARTNQEFRASADLGPSWAPGSLVDVVVRLRTVYGSFGLVRLVAQVITQSS